MPCSLTIAFAAPIIHRGHLTLAEPVAHDTHRSTHLKPPPTDVIFHRRLPGAAREAQRGTHRNAFGNLTNSIFTASGRGGGHPRRLLLGEPRMSQLGADPPERNFPRACCRASLSFQHVSSGPPSRQPPRMKNASTSRRPGFCSPHPGTRAVACRPWPRPSPTAAAPTLDPPACGKPCVGVTETGGRGRVAR